MKSDKEKKIAKPKVDESLEKYVGKNISDKKTTALNENAEQIKAALRKHIQLQVH